MKVRLNSLQKLADAASAAQYIRKVVDKTASHVHDVESENGIVIVKLHASDAVSLAALAEAGLR
jgi:hypothetical protein